MWSILCQPSEFEPQTRSRGDRACAIGGSSVRSAGSFGYICCGLSHIFSYVGLGDVLGDRLVRGTFQRGKHGKGGRASIARYRKADGLVYPN